MMRGMRTLTLEENEMRWMIRNSEGKRDATLTMTVVGFSVILVKIVLAGISIGSFSFGPVPDASVIAALLTPSLGSYVARRYTDSRFSAAAKHSSPEDREEI